MIELEAKVWLDKHGIDPKLIEAQLKNVCEFIGEKKKYDWYFSKKGEINEVFRLRQENEQYFVNHKIYHIHQGIETNEEIEFEVLDRDAFFAFTDVLGYEVSITKKKDTKLFKNDGFSFELSFLHQLGWFLEIEKICENTSDIEQEKKALSQAFSQFGMSQEMYENHKYLHLLRSLN